MLFSIHHLNIEHIDQSINQAPTIRPISTLSRAGYTCLVVFLGAQHFDSFAAGEAVPEAVAGHDEAGPLRRDLDLHDVRMRNDALPNIHIANGPAGKSTAMSMPPGAAPAAYTPCTWVTSHGHVTHLGPQPACKLVKPRDRNCIELCH